MANNNIQIIQGAPQDGNVFGEIEDVEGSTSSSESEDDQPKSARRWSSPGCQSPRGGLTRNDSDRQLGSRTNSTVQGVHGGGANKIRRLPDRNAAEEELLQEMNLELEKAANGHSSVSLDRLNLSTMPNFAGFTHLVDVNLAENSLTFIPEDAFLSMPLLEVLDLSQNRLRAVPLSALSLQRIHTLLLDHNDITDLPELWDDSVMPTEAPNLRKLGLEYNKLSRFPAHVFRQAPALRELFLAENPQMKQLCDPSVFATHPFPLTLRLVNIPSLVAASTALPAHVRLDWVKTYPDKVLDFLYLGSMRTAQCLEVYRDFNIKYVLTAARDLEVHLDDNMSWLELLIDDVPGEDITPFFEQANAFIDEARMNQKGILIHCFAGLSRSVTLTVAYIMKTYYPTTRDEALAFVRKSRPAAAPNAGFMKRLADYEKVLKQQLGNYHNPLPAEFL